jgi:hypothetical protein
MASLVVVGRRQSRADNTITPLLTNGEISVDALATDCYRAC